MAPQIVLDGHSTTDYVLTWLDTARQPHVLQVFDRACNLIDSEGRVISLVTPEIGNGPFNLGFRRLNSLITSHLPVQYRAVEIL